MDAVIYLGIPTALTMAEHDELMYLAAGKLVLEVGALLGTSTIAMATTAALVHSVDPHEGYPAKNPRPTLEQFIHNLKRYRVADVVVPLVGRDDQILPFLRPRSYDFAFVDLSLTDGTTERVVWHARRLLRPEGVLAVHDYGHETWPGATRVVDSLRLPFRLVDTLAIMEGAGT